MLLRQTLQYFPAQFLGPVFQFVSILTWTHYLSPTDLGLVALVTAVQELSLAATLGWFTHYTLRYAASFQGAAKTYLDTETFVILLSGTVTMLIVLSMPAFVDAKWTWPLLAAAVLQSVGRVAVAQLSDRTRTWGDPISYSILQIGWPVGGFLIALVLVLFVQPSATAVLAGYAIAQAAALVVVLTRIEKGRAPQHFARELLRKAATYAAPLVIGTVLIWVANNGIRFVVEWRDGAAAVGLVSVGWSVGLRIASVAAMVVTAAGFPLALARARDGGPSAGQAQLARNGLLLAAVLAPSAAGLWMIAGALVPLFVGAQFQEVTAAILPASILAGAARNFRIHCGEQVFLLHERPVVPLINDAVDAAAALLLGGFGLWYAGLPGLVAGAAVGAVVSLAVTMIWAWWDHGFAIPGPDVIRIGIATALMMAVIWTLPTAGSVLALGFVVAAGAAVFAAAMAALYPAERRKAIALAGGLLQRGNA
ncbi:lipopolysaccharide biosynthesis protein [Hyphomicrobium sp.]|uniref:lipopolysaccharide biosynthesis protein n=1 Tax=Hyphomicrobium sp. TaxID=82 RepID=UPI003F72827B